MWGSFVQSLSKEPICMTVNSITITGKSMQFTFGDRQRVLSLLKLSVPFWRCKEVKMNAKNSRIVPLKYT